MLKDILAVSGKPGLYRLVSKGSNLLIIESLTDKKRIPAYARDKVISLGDISIYTDDEETPLRDVLESIKKKENGKNPSIDTAKAQPDELRAYLAEVLPNFDRDRVYPNDIKKMLKWYEILMAAGITDFSEKEEDNKEKAEEKNEEKKSEAKTKTTKSSKTKSATAKRKETTKITGATTKAKSVTKMPKKTGGTRGS